MGEFSSEYAVKSSVRLSTKNAWALYARRRWPANGVKAAMEEWGLTEGEAKGLFAAQISQPTIDKIIDHRRGGFAIGLLILEIRTQTALVDFIDHEKERLRHERRASEEREQRLVEMATDLRAGLHMGPERGAELGARRARERRSFRG